ncbi:MAG: hypothetical protein C0601_02160 [Candidatus Muiribacterium halophilum]|uniref:Transglutaminase-like domain-containing protein n=1 Tax=Muiribacterium halophilum TaxID=2053465 RepID=A0A2N5ZKW0_MUIH1|nr:MAG: hypothetical protein C0601_02160 [Candidatus Muirbacterium halophilum]
MKKLIKIILFTLLFLFIFVFVDNLRNTKKNIVDNKKELTEIQKVWKEYQKNRSLDPKPISEKEFMNILEKNDVSELEYPFRLPSWYKKKLDEIKLKDLQDKAYAIFDLITDTKENSLNIEMSDSSEDRENGNRFPYELLTEKGKRKAKCDELALLYTASCRYLGLESYFVLVDVDVNGEFVAHACSGFIDNKKRFVLVDPAYRIFDVFHRLYRPLDDLEATACFLAGSHKILCELDRRADAGKYIYDAEKIYQDNDFVINELMLQSFSEGDYERSLNYALKVINMKGISPYSKFSACFGAGIANLYLGKFEESEKYFSDLIQLLFKLKKIADFQKEDLIEKILMSHLFYAGILQVNEREEAEDMLSGFHTNYNIPEEMIEEVEGVYEEAGVDVVLGK